MFLKNQNGFTLIETLVTLAIFSVTSLAVGWLLIHSLRVNDIVWEDLATQNEGRKVLQQVVDDVRRIEMSSLGAYAIASAGNNDLIFYANIDTDSLRERVHYWVDGTTLKKGILKPSGNPLAYSGAEQVTELAHSVRNIALNIPVFLYYNQNYTGTEPALSQPVNTTLVRLIKVQLELEKDPRSSPIPLHVETLAHIRSLKTE